MVSRSFRPLGGDLRLDPVGLLRRRVDAGDVNAVLLGGVEHEATESAAHVDDALSGGKLYLARDVFHLRDLRLEDALLRMLVVGAGVHEVGIVQHLRVELRPRARSGIGRFPWAWRWGRLLNRRPCQRLRMPTSRSCRVVEAGGEPDGHEFVQIAVDVDLAIEVGLEEADMAEHHGA